MKAAAPMISKYLVARRSNVTALLRMEVSIQVAIEPTGVVNLST